MAKYLHANPLTTARFRIYSGASKTLPEVIQLLRAGARPPKASASLLQSILMFRRRWVHGQIDSLDSRASFSLAI